MVDGVEVVHAVLDELAHLLEALVVAHARDRVALHEDVAPGEQLNGLEGGPVWSEQPVAPLDVALLVAAQAANLDDVARHVILEDAHRLLQRHAPREQLDHVARLEDGKRVPRLARRRDGHGALDEVELARHALIF